METINFGKISNVVLIGGGGELVPIALKFKMKGFQVSIITSKRLATAEWYGKTLEDWISENGLQLCITSNINDQEVKELINRYTLGISFGSPWIFKEEFIDLFNKRLLNCHARNLPKNRGGGGHSWMIMNGERKSAVLLHLVDNGIDTGDIVKKEDFIFPETCKLPEEYNQFTIEKIKLFFDDFIEAVINQETFQLIRQDEGKSTYFPRLYTPIQGVINWDWSAEEIIKFINAFSDPYCGASTYYRNKKVFVRKVLQYVEKENFHPFLNGLVYRVHNGKVYIVTKTGGIAISEINDEEGNNITDRVQVGRRFFTPLSDLEEAKKFYPIYTPEGLKENQDC